MTQRTREGAGPDAPGLQQPPTPQEVATGWERVVEVLRSQWHLVLLLVVALGVFGAMVAAAEEIYEAVQDGDDLAAVDQPLLDTFLAWRTPELDRAVTLYTDLGGTVWAPVFTLLLVVGLGVLWRSWTPVVLMVVATAGSLTMTSVGKVVVARARPDTSLAVPPFETSAAFPSGHTLNATVIAFTIAYLVWMHVRSRLVRVLVLVGAVVHAVLMGMSRVYLAHHWFTDVVVAWVLGIGWLALVVAVHQLVLARTGRRSRRPGTG
ncbi:phosphatase PAP2 family protein [Aquipuribacter sp. SD81]|uniref:phosphatase PAP2 family protein n=1 Tax=Aquipuribacter sp. SD81 TaxID=3127703 RepID=UPI003018D027